MPYPGSQGELNSEPLGLRGVGLACSEEWPCFWQTRAPPLSRQLEGLALAPAAGAVAMAAAAAAAAISDANSFLTVEVVALMIFGASFLCRKLHRRLRIHLWG